MYPDLDVVAGSKGILDELNSIIKLKDSELLFSYDTTFSLGEFYVSPLVFKNILFENNPLMAALFLIHERKLEEIHNIFFRTLSSQCVGIYYSVTDTTEFTCLKCTDGR